MLVLCIISAPAVGTLGAVETLACPRAVNWATHVRLGPRLRISGSLLVLPLTPLWCGQGQGKVKVEFTLEQVTKAQRGSRCIALLLLQPRR